MFDFKDHQVLVTGAGAGIGLAIAQAFHAAGARVALGDLRERGLAGAAEYSGTTKR
jgi:NAD(P)-dependent dehydrogenase (short-subunit alcohol dehydrogenase family)